MKGAFPSTPRPRFPSLPVAGCYRSMTCRTSCRCAAPFTAVTYEPSRSRYSRKIRQRLPSELTLTRLAGPRLSHLGRLVLSSRSTSSSSFGMARIFSSSDRR